MTKEKSKIQKFIFLALLLTLSFACKRDNVYPPGNKPAVRMDAHQPYPQNHHRYVRPNSRAYTNPYNPPQSYYPYYDFDQYYVPPTQYKNVEQDNNNSFGPSSKF